MTARVVVLAFALAIAACSPSKPATAPTVTARCLTLARHNDINTIDRLLVACPGATREQAAEALK